MNLSESQKTKIWALVEDIREMPNQYGAYGRIYDVFCDILKEEKNLFALQIIREMNNNSESFGRKHAA